MSLAAIFPGQGSQSVGMLSELAAAFPQVSSTFQEASDALDQDLWALVTGGPEEALADTENTQPVMLTAGVAVWRVWCASDGPAPRLMAGHSVSEYTALVCAGAIEFGDAVRLVRRRASLMQAAVPKGEGAIAAVLGLDDEQAIALCAAAAGDDVLAAVNFNSPGQVVIAGHAAAVERAIEIGPAMGARKIVPLAMSVPAHSPLMEPAAEALLEALRAVSARMPEVPVIQNADVVEPRDVEMMVDALKRQLYNPVRWSETIRLMVERGVTQAIEMGPGRVLTGLNKRIDKSLQGICVQDCASLEKALQMCQEIA